MGGPFLQLPAGRAFVSANLNAHLEDFDTATDLTDAAAASAHLSRTTARLRVFSNFPLTNRSAGVLPALGDLALRLNFSEQEVSNFGALTSSGFGLNWSPIKVLNFNAAFNVTRYRAFGAEPSRSDCRHTGRADVRFRKRRDGLCHHHYWRKPRPEQCRDTGNHARAVHRPI